MDRRVLVGAVAWVGGCYDPTIPVGLPCGDGCPSGQICVEGFCQVETGGDEDGPRADSDPADPDAPPRDCWSAWRSGNVGFGTLRMIAELDAGSEGDAYLARDDQTLFFARGTSGTRDFYRAVRAGPGATFGQATPVTELNSTADESRLGMADNQRLVVLASTRPGGAGLFDLYQATRNSTMQPFSTPSSALFTALNNSVAQHDPWLTEDGLRLYYAPQDAGAQALHLATRMATDRPFGPPTQLAGLEPVIQADPTLSPDERVVVYGATTMAGGQVDLYVATRSAASGPFENSTLLGDISSPASDADPALSSDGCELIFTSDRDGSDRDLYLVEVNR